MSEWEVLSDPLLLKILKYLEPKDIISCSKVCTHWYRICQDNLLWKEVFERDFLNHTSSKSIVGNETQASSSTIWKNEYERLSDRVPCVISQTLQKHTDEVVHIAFSHNGYDFASCSKDTTLKIWRKKKRKSRYYFEPCFSTSMLQYKWIQTYSAQYSPSDINLLVSGVTTGITGINGCGEIAIFQVAKYPDGNYTLLKRVPNNPFDFMGCWYSDISFFAGSIEWHQDDLYDACIWLITIPYDAKPSTNHESISLPLGDGWKMQKIFTFETPEGANSPHFIQCVTKEKANENTKDEISLIFICGNKTYVAHQVGFQNLERNWMTDDFEMRIVRRPTELLEMDGQIIGMASTDVKNKYAFVNVRKWVEKEGTSMDDQMMFHPPDIHSDIEVRRIDLKTMEIKKEDIVLKGHKGYTSSEGAFYLYLDASKDYVASGSEDCHGYIWDKYYGAILARLEHQKCVNAVVFDPSDQETCITASDDLSLKVWISKRRNRILEKVNSDSDL